jgi:nitroreductase
MAGRVAAAAQGAEEGGTHDRAVEEPGLLATMSSMRAMRRLAPDPVPEAILTGLIEAATWAPSGNNAQAESFVLVTDRAVMARLAPIWRRAVDTYLAIIDAAHRGPWDEASSRVRAAILYQRDHFAETPALIVACYDDAAVRRSRRDMGTIRRVLRAVGVRELLVLSRAMGRFADRSAAASVYPAVENLLLAARAAGLGACMTTWHLLVEPDLKRVLGIPNAVDTYAVIPIGWPLGQFGPVTRRPVHTFVRRDGWAAR